MDLNIEKLTKKGGEEKMEETVQVGSVNEKPTDEESIVRFENNHPPRKAKENESNLAAVCCPSFSLS